METQGGRSSTFTKGGLDFPPEIDGCALLRCTLHYSPICSGRRLTVSLGEPEGS